MLVDLLLTIMVCDAAYDLVGEDSFRGIEVLPAPHEMQRMLRSKASIDCPPSLSHRQKRRHAKEEPIKL